MKYILLLCALITTTYYFAQSDTRNYRIHVSNSPLYPNSLLKEEFSQLKSNTSALHNGHFYVLIQLEEIPSTKEKSAIQSHGIELLQYIPNYAWISKVDTSVRIETLQAARVRHILPIEKEWKLSEELIYNNVPTHAGDTNNAIVTVIFIKPMAHTELEQLFKDFNIQLLDVGERLYTTRAQASVASLKLFATHPIVQYIEFVEPPIREEGIKEESERIISPYISDNPGKGYYFDGTGINIGVDEGGIFDTLENPNFRGRIIRNFESGTAVGGHKTSVGVRMAKAGNIDPTQQGTAFGANLFSGGISTGVATSNDIVIVNRSYGWGCPGGSTTYGSSSADYDYDVRTNPSFIITHSAGNAGGSNCYAGSAGWGNITGIPKMAKNIFNVGSSGSDGTLTGFSSRGPAKDGRILPHIVAPGPGGTSHASPNLAGVFAQLNQAYRFHNNNNIPHSGLLKAIIMNTADDMGNPGPDFKTGFGHVNARRAYEVIRANNFETASVSQGVSNVHTINVPNNTKELKVMVYWVDWEAAAGITTRSLVNDLDIVLEDPMSNSFQPWVLNPTFDSILLDMPALRATDSLNNHEQITIKNPVAGTYSLTVNGTLIPQGPQTYFMTYEVVEDEIMVTYPHGGEKFVPGETERIRWDACDSNLVFDISYSPDNGMSWSIIATGVNADNRFYDWTVPQDLTDEARIRVERGATLGQSDTTFTISEQPDNLALIWSCSDSSLFVWDDFPSADSFIVYRIVGDYMTQVATTSSNSIVLNGLSQTESEFVSVAVVQNGILSRRLIAIERAPEDINCNANDLGALEILNPSALNIPDCMIGNGTEIRIRVQNWGVNSVDSIPVAYRVNGGIITADTIYTSLQTGGNIDFSFTASPSFVAGNNLLEIWTAYPGDAIFNNDTVSVTIDVYTSTTMGPNLSQDFDNFTNCSTAWDCELVTCGLQEGWYNVPNGAGDDIDWRTHSGATGSANTGPSSDHTSGSGKYLYIEGSGPCNNSTAQLNSPCIDLTGINTATLSFWYHAWGSSIGELHVDALADGVYHEDIVSPIIGEQGNQWNEVVADLSPFADKLVVVVIRGSNGSSGWESDLAIDDINIAVGPVANFTSATTQICSNDAAILNNMSVYADTYEWSIQPNTYNFVGGTNANSTNPQVSFSAGGNYTVQLIASSAFGEDTLQYTDYIYVWEDQPPLSLGSVCQGDSVIVAANNFGQPVDYYLNGTLMYSGTDSMYYFDNAAQGDEIYVVYNVNSACSLVSDTVLVDFIIPQIGVNQSGIQLEAEAVGVQYQWLDCTNNFSVITGEVNALFTPSLDGSYAVEITDNGCIDTSTCISFSTASLSDLEQGGFVFFPNPTSGKVTVVFDATQQFIDVEILNTLGQTIRRSNARNVEEFTIELPQVRAVYFLRIATQNATKVVSVMRK
jgi:PKD repeat protein